MTVEVAIPRIIHRIWVGPEELPAEFAAFGEQWADMHPGWEHRLWTEDNLPGDVRRSEVLDRNRIPPSAPTSSATSCSGGTAASTSTRTWSRCARSTS